MAGRSGVVLVFAGAALGALVTVAASKPPGPMLGVFVVVATAAAVLAVRRRAAYLIIPAPALAYLLAAAVAGLAHDHAGLSRTALAVSAAQWTAGGFLAMAVATLVAIVATAARWPWRSRDERDREDPPPAASPHRARTYAGPSEADPRWSGRAYADPSAADPPWRGPDNPGD